MRFTSVPGNAFVSHRKRAIRRAIGVDGYHVCMRPPRLHPLLRAMRSQWRRILVFLLLGAVVNVLVAWGCIAYIVSYHSSEVFTLTSDDERYIESIGEHPRSTQGTWYYAYGWTVRVIMLRDDAFDEYQSNIKGFSQWAEGYDHSPVGTIWAGWPMRSLKGRFWVRTWDWIDAHDPASELPELVHDGTFYSPIWFNKRTQHLPYHPFFPGFVVNTALYAVLLFGVHRWIVMPTVRASIRVYMEDVSRTMRRRRRGHCPRCNYDLQHNLDAGCTECGWNRAPLNADG